MFAPSLSPYYAKLELWLHFPWKPISLSWVLAVAQRKASRGYPSRWKHHIYLSSPAPLMSLPFHWGLHIESRDGTRSKMNTKKKKKKIVAVQNRWKWPLFQWSQGLYLYWVWFSLGQTRSLGRWLECSYRLKLILSLSLSRFLKNNCLI